MPIQFRQSGCLLEYSEDSGTTWNVAADLSQCSQIVSPVETGEALRCSVAAFLTDNLHYMQDKIISGKQATSSLDTVVADATGVLIGVGALLTDGLVLGIAALIAETFGALGEAGSQDLTDFDNSLSSVK